VLAAVFIAHVVVVLVAARVAGLGDDLDTAVLIAAVALAAAAAASLGIRAASGRWARSPAA
jgi:hypothetical protein